MEGYSLTLHSLSHVRAFVCGGSAAPRSIIEKFEYHYGIPFYHAYGMTETSPMVTCVQIKSNLADVSKDKLLDIRSTQGLPVPGVEMKIVGANGEIAWDGKEMGELLLRGPWIARRNITRMNGRKRPFKTALVAYRRHRSNQ